MSITTWDPFRDLQAMREEISRFFEQLEGRERGERFAWAPPLDIGETDDAYLVRMDLPGVRPEELSITVDDGLLTVEGERREEREIPGRHQHRVERRYGRFRRSITLPRHIKSEQIDASYEDGVLEITVPKAEEAKPRRLEVRTGRPAVEGTAREGSA